VSAFPWRQYDVPGLVLLVQSPSHDARAVHDAMKVFLAGVPGDIDAEQFARHRAALINDILKPHENLGERAEFYWQAIAFRHWNFDQPRELAAALEAIEYDEWKAYYARAMLEMPRSLLAFSRGGRDVVPSLEEAAMFNNADALRKASGYYPIDLNPL